MAHPVTQQEFSLYEDYLKELKVIEKLVRKDQLRKLGFQNGRFVKASSSSGATGAGMQFAI